MSSFCNVDVHSEFFTPQEFPVEILEIAKARDVIPCCLGYSAKQFLSFMLFKETYFLHDGISVFIQDQPTDDGDNLLQLLSEHGHGPGPPGRTNKEGHALLQIPRTHIPLEGLSNVPAVRLRDLVPPEDPKYPQGLNKENGLLANLPVPCAIICSRRKFLELTRSQEPRIPLDKLTLVVCDNVHEALTDQTAKSSILKILKVIRDCNKLRADRGRAPVRSVFLTVSLLHFYGNESDGFWRMRETFCKLERLCGAKVDATSDVTALLRYSSPVAERIISMDLKFLEEVPLRLNAEVLAMLTSLRSFLETHMFDPIAAFGYDPTVESTIKEIAEEEEEQGEKDDVDSIAEELENISQPSKDPLQIIAQFESVLENFGPWCAERSLTLLLQLVERLKVRTPYERHYLLLGALQTRLILLQSAFSKAFKDLEPLQVLELYSTPKLRAVLQVLRRFDLTTPIEPKTNEDDDDDDEEEDELKDLEDDSEVVEPQPPAASTCRERRGKNPRFDQSKRGRHYKNRRRNPVGAGIAQEQEEVKTTADIMTVKSNETETLEETKTATSEESALEQTEETESIDKEKDDGEKVDSKDDKSNLQFRRHRRFIRKVRQANRGKDPALCGIIFVQNRFDARILFHYLKEAAILDARLVGLNPTLAICSSTVYGKDSREAEMEHKKREDNLRKFRYREANLLIGTSIVEDGIELPKANLVVRFDAPKTFRSYLFSKGRAQGKDAEFFMFVEDNKLDLHLKQLATYRLVEEILLQHSILQYLVPTNSEEEKRMEKIFPRFKAASLSSSIAIVNRYCARLPSDTFTRLVPLWSIRKVQMDNGCVGYKCILRLPINSPVKWPIQGISMPSEILAKMAVAVQTVMVLHANGELDDCLLPIGKEGVIHETDLSVPEEQEEEELAEFRPGSTKRRQYYDKKIVTELTNCIPHSGKQIFVYWIQMVLTCPLPEEQNTRGRKLHPPELSVQSFGIILSKEIDMLPAYPIYTRCGEVEVKLVRVSGIHPASFTAENLEKISSFHHYTFTSVLRLDKYLTLFDPELSENSYYVVPLKTVEFDRSSIGIVDVSSSRVVDIDWEFVNVIWGVRNRTKPIPVSDEERSSFEFRKEAYNDAVVIPWYRSHDAPQYFYVAEICKNLTPESQFPGCEFKTFHEYYQKKYNISIQCVNQPLLDVDHTSARLNFLTPRYVNRKGMALPTSSESTKKAKRENLEQKQILVPELCAIHPFSASLWRQAVCLPCILYRLNCLLLANSIRTTVASEIHGLGLTSLPKGFKWDALSFGWSLADVLGYNQQTKKDEKSPDVAASEGTTKSEEDVIEETPVGEQNGENDSKKSEEGQKQKEEKVQEPEEPEEELTGFAKAAKEPLSAGVSLTEALLMNEKHLGKSANEILSEELKKCKQPSLDIGMWSNDMAANVEAPENEFEEEEDELIMDPMVGFPSNLMMLDKNWTWGGRSRLFNHRVHRALYGSPTHWGEVWDNDAFIPVEDLEDKNGHSNHHDDNDAASVASDGSGSDASYLDEENSMKIQFHSGNTAEALDKRKFGLEQRQEDMWTASEDLWWQMDGIDEESKDDEETLRGRFENEVNIKMKSITDILPFDSLEKLPPRAQGGQVTAISEDDNADPTLEAEVTSGTALKPPFAPTIPHCNGNQDDPPRPEAENLFSFDHQPSLHDHCGPSPCQILQAVTMSNANDGLNLERLETIGDSFLKYAITSYLFCTYEDIHEGKLSHLRSKQVSNVHLYRLGRRRGLGKVMVAAKFEPHDNWLPPGYHIPKHLDKALITSKLAPSHVSMAQVAVLRNMSLPEMEAALKTHSIKSEAEFIPYNLVTQQSIPDKSIADCVEALIGAYLTSMGPQGALLFMSWLGMRVLPLQIVPAEGLSDAVEALKNEQQQPFYMNLAASEEVVIFSSLKPPKSPLLRYDEHCEEKLRLLLKGYEDFEESIGYRFQDRSYLLQAFTHASYSTNDLTDCYQRLEFLGDAILDYLITRHLYEDPRQHSPGALTDLRSALVNNTIFASLAVKNNFHKYFRHASPGLNSVLQKFVSFQEQHGNTLTQDYYLMDEEECEEAEDIEVPKALGDVFESVAGAIFLDSKMSLDAVWRVYYRIMKDEIDAFSKNVPKSPIRELLELEPETAKFGKPEKLWDGRRVRVTVEIFGVGVFRGIGRNYRIAKCTAAKCALRHVRKIRQNQARRY